jgi:gliding motility-associated-like protein
MCNLNPLFYHSIQRTAGSTAADIRMFYINAADGNWGGMGHWQTASVNWNNMGTMSTGTSGIFSTVTRNAWAFINPGDPYVLANIRPQQPSITCPNICENSNGNTFTLTGTSSTYQWTVPANGNIVSGQGTSSIDVDWTTGTGYITVYAVGTGGCNSLADSCQPSVLPKPTAYFSTDGSTGAFSDTYSFTDSSFNATSWAWDFGDGGTSTEQNPTYEYSGAGTYTVILTVSNGACSDTAMRVLDASEGIIIPNVFSPNGDGANDNFFITASGLKEYSLSIYNRWGELMFESGSPRDKWDGTHSGKKCEDATYFFILKARSTNKDYSTTGTITLTGSK